MKNTNSSLQRRHNAELQYFRQMLERHPEYFVESHDIGTAAALLCSSFKLVSVVKECSGRPSFIFEVDDEDRYESNTATSAKLMAQYVTGQLSVNARSFFEHLSGLEGELRSQYGK